MNVLDLRESASRRDRVTLDRLETIIPALMRRYEIECWILVSREYAEDPVAQTMLPATWMSSRRRTILVFFTDSDSHERFAVTRYEVDGLFPASWDPERQPDQFAALAELVKSLDPDSIAISTSENFAHADGLTATESAQLMSALGAELTDRIVSGEALAIGWLQTRLPVERAMLEEACSVAHGILRRALSREAITPGDTTTKDLEWWLRSRVQDVGTTTWFHPSVSIQRKDGDLRGSFSAPTGDHTIEPGDLVHIDFGIDWDHLSTDQQQHGYVLLPGESSAPAGLNHALDRANRLQDILLGVFSTGTTGNEILASALEKASFAGLRPSIYTHPIGYHGHGAGPTIGLWDQQDGVVGAGDIEVLGPSAWSIELLNRSEIPEWGNAEVAIMLEEEAWFEDEDCSFVDGRQTAVWEI